MPIYTGKSEDGSDMREVEGMYINPNNSNEWSSKPYPQQRRQMSLHKEVLDYMEGKYTLRDVYNQIQGKRCPLSKRVRDYVLSHFDMDGNFITDKE